MVEDTAVGENRVKGRVEGEGRAVCRPRVESKPSVGVIRVVKVMWRYLQVERKSNGQAVSNITIEPFVDHTGPSVAISAGPSPLSCLSVL